MAASVNRRDFILGVMGSAALAALPVPAEKPFPEGWVIGEEIVEPGLYGDIGERYAKALARSMQQTKEHIGAEIYERKMYRMAYSITQEMIDE